MHINQFGDQQTNKKNLSSSKSNSGKQIEGGIKWIQAEHRVRPEFLQAQTGLMQGAAGIGLWLLRLDAFDHSGVPKVIFPDDPFSFVH